MQQVTKHPNNHFSWIDLMSTDIEASATFYADLFGWTAAQTPMPDGNGVYHMFQMSGLSVAGGGQMSPEMSASGHPSYWSSYLNVEDIAAAHEAAVTAGAETIMPPTEIGPSGHLAIIKDPTGGIVGLWQANMHIGAQLVNVPGALVWNELATRDVEGAKAFYSTVFGWTYETDENGYVMILNNGRANGGMMAMGDSFPAEVPPHWSIYFMVDDAHAAAAKATELGATTVVPVTNIGTMDFTLMNAPTGEGFYLIRSDNVDPMP